MSHLGGIPAGDKCGPGPPEKCARPNQRDAKANFFLNILMNDFKHRNITPNTMVTGLGHVTPVVLISWGVLGVWIFSKIRLSMFVMPGVCLLSRNSLN